MCKTDEGKTKVLWGAGRMCIEYLEKCKDTKIGFIIDSNISKKGEYIKGLKIVHPSDISNWEELYVVITVIRNSDIVDLLLSKGLKYNVDFMTIDFVTVSSKRIDQSVAEEKAKLTCTTRFEYIIRSKKEWYDYYLLTNQYKEFEKAISRLYWNAPDHRYIYHGYCTSCEKEADFYVDFTFGTNKTPAWTESLMCYQCGCNSRMRYIILRVKEEYRKGMRVYAYERITRTYKQLSKFIDDFVGSEYLGADISSGTYINNIVDCDGNAISDMLHEDATNLSFEDESFDIMVSCDVFEHVADSNKAFSEAYRCLKPGGKIIMTVPLYYLNQDTEVRAAISSDGKLKHLMEPIYHGNPLSCEGSLAFRIFGWDIIDTLKSIGFQDAYARAYYSVNDAFLGYLPVCFEAIK